MKAMLRWFFGILFVAWLATGTYLISGRKEHWKDQIHYRATRVLRSNHLVRGEDFEKPAGLPGELEWYLPEPTIFLGKYLLTEHSKGIAIRAEEVSASPDQPALAGGMIWLQTLEKGHSHDVDAGTHLLLWSSEGECLATGNVSWVACTKDDCQAVILLAKGSGAQALTRQKSKPILLAADTDELCPADKTVKSKDESGKVSDH